jgi:transcriptional regulator with XRE-family HTH domain
LGSGIAGEAIRICGKVQTISQEEAAERCGPRNAYYSGVERGVRNLSLVNIEKIAEGRGTNLGICLVALDKASPKENS